MEFGAEICTDFEKSSKLEWLETNGIGGFASGTISGANTRRYHGLLVAATKPPLGRLVLLSKLEETLIVNGKSYELSANQYPNSVHPNGYVFLKEFHQNPLPTWVYETEDFEIEKTVFMPTGENSTFIEYKFAPKNPEAKQDCKLEIRPLLAFRDYHQLKNQDANFDANYSVETNYVSVQPHSDMPELYINFDHAEVEKTGFWYRDFEYAIEKERGFDFREDLFQPFVLKFDLKERKEIFLIASTSARNIKTPMVPRLCEVFRRETIVSNAGFENEFLQKLVAASDQFIVSRGAGKTIIAGYHWFSDWGRDTMIALTGLTLTTNRAEIAKSILLEFSNHISQGMIPNRFPDEGDEPEYNTVDGTLWYFEAVRAFLQYTKDYDFVLENLYDKFAEIIAWHVRGTRYNIKVDDDGLLFAGEKGVQLTWMDAKIGDWVVTPRIGKPVEIQALWYNALRLMESLAEKFGDADGKNHYQSMADLASKSFNEKFWNAEEQCLFDVVNGDENDGSIRPNQIFAVSLKNSMVDKEKAKKIVRKVEEELLTPVGLRSLSPKDPNYVPIYIGSPLQRDSSYHQGTVWAWQLGAFLTAYAKSFRDEIGTSEKLHGWLGGIENYLADAGIGQISEIFDGDFPHPARGCMAQAWSVAEILRAAAEDVYKTK